MKNHKSIAVLITCYNRVNSTLKCLKHLYNASVPEGYYIDVFLVDDNSPDETGRIVKMNYPVVNVIKGTGTLYWNGGMRLAWQTAARSKDYDFYLWLNDDTFINLEAIKTIISDYSYLQNLKKECLIIGALTNLIGNKVTYSGWKDEKIIIPNDKPIECSFIVGNFVLISNRIFRKIGPLSSLFSHSIGDVDYGYRAIKNGFNCFVTSKIVGKCNMNDKLPWYSPKFKLNHRYKLLISKTNGNIFEYLKFVRIHKGLFKMIASFFKNLIRLFFPKLF